MASTELRMAAQKALEALELGYDSAKAEADQYHAAMAGYRPQRHAQMDADVQQIAAAITALKAALAEPVQDGKCKYCVDGCPACDARKLPVQEPVAWMYTGIKQDGTEHGPHLVWRPEYMDAMSAHKGAKATPLYAAPPQRKPLTEEEIDSIWDSEKAFADIYAIARAVERAHGIDGAPEERNFCPRCGKRANGIHTCTPPAPLTDEVIADLWHQNGGFHHHFARAIERWLRGHA